MISLMWMQLNLRGRSMTDAARKIDYTKDPWKGAIETLERINEEATRVVADSIDALQSENEELKVQLASAKGEVDDLLFVIAELRAEQRDILAKSVSPDTVRDLAKARTDLYSGRADEGRFRVERVLDELDNAWRTMC